MRLGVVYWLFLFAVDETDTGLADQKTGGRQDARNTSVLSASFCISGLPEEVMGVEQLQFRWSATMSR